MSPDTIRAGVVPGPAPAADAGAEKARPVRDWVVRADGGQYTDHFVAGGYAAVGWFDLSSASSRDEIRRRYVQEYPEAPSGQIANETGQIAAFRLDMSEGDYVITPMDDLGWLRFGRVAGPCVSVVEGDGCPRRNRRTVEWADARLRRHDFSESLQNTLGSSRTVFNVVQREEFLAAIEEAEGGVRPTRGGRIGEVDSMREGSSAPGASAVAHHPVEADADTGVEVEPEDPQHGTIDRPFDPSKIRVRTVHVVVDQP